MQQLEQLLELSKQKGAAEAEVYQVRSQSRPVFFEGNRLKQLESSQSEGTALRIWRDNCPGLAVAYGQVDAETLVDKALALSQLNEPETIELTEARTEIVANQGTILPVETFIEMGQNAITTLRQAYPEIICSAEFECEEETTTLINSRGLYCQYTDTSLSYYLGAELVRGEDFLGIYDGEYSRKKLNPEQIVQQIIQRLDWAKTNTTSLTGKVPVLFTANAVTMLWGTVSAALSGKRVLEGSSPWSESKGKPVVSELITLTQQPDKEPYSCPFDDEGVVTQPLNLIVDGRLEQFYCDRAIGRELGISSTGNGFRPGLGSYPTPSLINLIVKAGYGSLFDLIHQLNNGIIRLNYF
jgi:PmbA protein